MKTIAILCGRYLPGYKDGGPVRSIINLVNSLGEEYNFKIITSDRDHGDEKAYPKISYDKPNRVGHADVWYLKPGDFRVETIKKHTSGVDLIYICGPYNDYAYKTMLMKRLGIIKEPVVIASMGAFSEGAFQIKNVKKKIYISALKALGCFSKIAWSVTSELEKKELQHIVGKKQKCFIAEDLPRSVPDLKIQLHDGPIRVVFLSRISEKKNLLYAIKILRKVNSRVVFDIYGNIEDVGYWKKCEAELQNLPRNIQWNYCGIADSERVIEVFSNYEVFLFPTLGENYGHVIFEALAGGCIPIISDQTPWKELEQKNCGRVFPLSDIDCFSKEIERLATVETDQFERMRRSANEYVKEKYSHSVECTGYRKIFG